MTKIGFIPIILGALLYAGAADAQASRTWVSTAGSDSNSCIRSSPCATFFGAYTKTLAGGEIDVLDGGDFGPLTIGHAITIANEGAGTAAITPPDSTVPAIQVNAGSDAVVLRGLTLNGVNSTNAGVSLLSGSLLIDHCTIQVFHSQPGISFMASNAPSAATLWLKDTVLLNDGASSSGSIYVFGQPAADGTPPVTVHLERVQILHAIGNGIRVDGVGGTRPIDVELHDVTVDGASGGSGVVAVSQTSGGPTVKLVADNVTSSHNAGYGFRAVGGTSSIYLSRSLSENNGVGVGAASGGVVFSYGDDRLANNTGGNGVTPTAVPLE